VAAKSSTSRKKPAGKKSATKKPAPKPKAKPKPKPKSAAKGASVPKGAAAERAAKALTPKPAPAPKPAAAKRPAASPAPAPRHAVRANGPVQEAIPSPPAPEPETVTVEPRGARVREPRAHPDAGLTKAQVKRLHARLLEERNAVLAEIRRSVQGAVEEVPVFTESIDQAQHETEQNFRLRLADKQRKLLNEIQAALLKLEEGEYGICEGTEDPIGYARLEVRPWARYSVEYKELKDRRER
jgi:DnaK suppressor protein